MTLDLKPAFEIAVQVHGSQRDKAGLPYLGHLFRVMEQMETDEERVVAILHDVLEDGPGGIERISTQCRISSVYGDDVLEAIFSLTRDPGEPYSDYIRRLSTNPLAVKVKFADLTDNMNPQRLRKLPRDEANRLFDKYTNAYNLLYCCAEEAEEAERTTP